MTRWAEFRAALALIHRTKQLNETEFCHQPTMIIWQCMDTPPTLLQSPMFVCADGPRRPNRCLTSLIPSITHVQTVQLEAGDFLYDLFVSFQQFVYTETQSKAGKIGSMWIDSNSSIDYSSLKHCSFILNVTVWYCFCINMYLIMCYYVNLILVSWSFQLSCILLLTLVPIVLLSCPGVSSPTTI